MAKMMLGCESKIDELTERYGTDELTIAPIGNFRVIRDLVVDWESKVDRLKEVAPFWIFLKHPTKGTKSARAKLRWTSKKNSLLVQNGSLRCCASE